MPKFKVAYSRLSAFTDTPGMGNGAGVVLQGETLSTQHMQYIARRLGLPETVFVVASSESARSRRYTVRYFTPSQEIDFCGHATVALGMMLATQRHLGGARNCILDTKVGDIYLELDQEQGIPSLVWMHQPQLQLKSIDRSYQQRFAEAFGISERLIHRVLPFQRAYTGLWTVCLPLIDSMVIDAVEPDLASISQLCAELSCESVHIYASMGVGTFYTRNFAPQVGIPEDPVTGSASGALIALLAQHSVLPRIGQVAYARCLQGHALGSGGEVAVEIHFDQDRIEVIRVGGGAVIEREGFLMVPKQEQNPVS